MIRNYLKLAVRNIGRRKLYTVINLFGLSVASAFCILVYWYVQHERSFDRFHKQVGQLYRVETNNGAASATEEKSVITSFFVKGAEENNGIVTPPVLAGELQKALPEIEAAVRIRPGYEEIVRVNNQSFVEKENTALADASFFEIFNFPLKEGNPATVLAGRNVVVLSETAARKYFGHTEAVGKTILLPNQDSTLFTVSGVAKDFPAASSFRYDLVMPRQSVAGYEEEISNGLNTSSDLLILKVKEGTNVVAFRQKLDAVGRAYYAPFLKEVAAFPGSELKPANFHMHIRPFAEAHYNSAAGWGHYTDLKNLFQLACLALIILIIACVNYVLLTLTGTVSRSQEVGIRKTVGAPRKTIIAQFYIETQLLAVIAVCIGFLLAGLSLPFFSSLTGAALAWQSFSLTDIVLALVMLAFVLGLLAGIYPALVMSGLKPLNMMQKNATYRLNPYLSKVLVVLQFAVCIVLITASLVIGKQMRYMNEAKLGFDTEQILSISSPYSFADAEQGFQLKERLKQYVATQTALEGVTASTLPFQGYQNINNHLINGEKTMVIAFNVDYDYFKFYKIPIEQGRSFSPALASDSMILKLSDAQKMPGASAARQATVVNETLYKMLGQPPLSVINRELGGPIIGVCKDYHTADLTQKIAPAYHRIERRFIRGFSIKIKKGQNIPQVMDKLKSTWNKLTGNAPFSYTFLDENIAKSYDAYLRWMRTITASCVLAIVIACLGLFGLSGLTSVSRTKEIGIRKVLGASVSDLFLLLNKNTLLLSLFSFVVAVPIALYFVNAWLQNFAYRIHPGWPLFLLSGLLSLLTALIAVSYHTLKTAKANPVKSLRTE